MDSTGESRQQTWNRAKLFSSNVSAPETLGILATGGGLIFSGSIDRWFSAHNDQAGEELWRIRLNDVSGSAPVKFAVGSKQFVAAAVGNGSAHPATWPGLVLEIQNPPNRGGPVWVFEVP